MAGANVNSAQLRLGWRGILIQARHSPANQLVCLRACVAGEAGRARTRNPGVFGSTETPTLGFPATPIGVAEVQSRRLRRRSRPGMTVWGDIQHPNIYSYIPLTISPSGLYSPLSCPTERGDRDRHVRGVGCGGRRRCGVTRFMGERLSSGRTDLRQHCHWQGDGRSSDRQTPGQCDGRPSQNAFGQVLCGYPVPPPWDINFGDGTVRHGRCASNRKNTAGGT
ncbi:hypothetical protein SAMN05216367_0001, partial [Tardiphaga sp. OK245]